MWRANNKEHNKEYAAKYHQEIRKPILQTKHKPKEKQCKQCQMSFIRTAANQNFCSFKCRDRFSYIKNKEQILKDKASYYKINKLKINEQKKLYKREQRKDPYQIHLLMILLLVIILETAEYLQELDKLQQLLDLYLKMVKVIMLVMAFIYSALNI